MIHIEKNKKKMSIDIYKSPKWFLGSIYSTVRDIARLITVIDISLFLVILIYFVLCLIYLLTFLCILGDRKQQSKYKWNFEDILNRTIKITKMSDTSITVIYHTMSLTVLYTFSNGWRKWDQSEWNLIYSLEHAWNLLQETNLLIMVRNMPNKGSIYSPDWKLVKVPMLKPRELLSV